MFFFYYKKLFPDDVLVYVEEFNKQNGTVLFDFIDSNEYILFNNFLSRQFDLNKPSMVLLTNYKGKTIRENTIYSIKPGIIQTWNEQISRTSERLNSFLIGYTIDCSKTRAEIFNSSVSLSDNLDWHLNYYMRGRGDSSKIPFQNKGKLSVTIRNVGQGNWNEIKFNNETKIVYDAGAPMNAPRTHIRNLIGNRNSLYSSSKPILILSHWDKDHYHSLLGMSDNDLRNNFSAFVCRDRVPNLTSRILFARLSNAVGTISTYAIAADPRLARGGPTLFRNINSRNSQLVLYNAQQHKNRNISGLALSVKTSFKSIILSGDAHYEQISRDILQHLNYRHKHSLIVPHHGGKAGNYHYNIPNRVSLERAIISVGANRYGHPLATYIGALQASGFFVQQTNTVGNDITINL